LYNELENYLLEILSYSFNPNNNINYRKLILFVEMILIKKLGGTYLNNFMKFLLKIVNSVNEFIKIVKHLDFSILNEIGSYSFQGIDTSLGYLKAIENLLYDIIGTHNLKIEDKNLLQVNEAKIVQKMDLLKNFIFLIEGLIFIITKYNELQVNIIEVYSFYFSMQMKV
jgi:hypothetical protein